VAIQDAAEESDSHSNC